jgi:triacylglycerol lipase
MQATPRGSLPMYFPGSPFVLADAVACGALVDVAYDQYTQWYNQDYPSKGNFVWTKPNNGYTYSTPLFWTNEWFGRTYDEPFGFAAVDQGGNAYLVFRGTMSDADEYQDLRTDQAAYQIVPGYGCVHAGFYTIYRLLSPQVHAVLLGLNKLNPFVRFFFTGHSLGCGLSSLAVPDVLANSPVHPKTIPVLHYNLASPRVGDPQFAYAMNGNGVPTYRIVNTEDLVPDAPPAVLGTLLFKHIGTPVDFTAQYDTIVDNHSLDVAYRYALANPDNPEGPLPQRTLGVARRTGVRVTLDGQLTRLSPAATTASVSP